MSTIDDTDTLLAAVACERLIRRFARLSDQGDFVALAALFTEDGVFARPSAPTLRIEGRAAILAAYQARPKRASRHVTANVLVDLLSPTSVTATSQILLFAGTDTGYPMRASAPLWVGEFQDRLELRDGRWLFKERLGTLEFEFGRLDAA